MSAPVDALAPRNLLRDRNMAVLFGGETVSELGSSMTFLVFPLIAIGLGASSFMIGVIAAATNAARSSRRLDRRSAHPVSMR